MAQDKGILGLRNRCLTNQKNNKGLSNSKKKKHQGQQNGRSLTTSETNSTKVYGESDDSAPEARNSELITPRSVNDVVTAWENSEDQNIRHSERYSDVSPPTVCPKPLKVPSDKNSHSETNVLINRSHLLHGIEDEEELIDLDRERVGDTDNIKSFEAKESTKHRISSKVREDSANGRKAQPAALCVIKEEKNFDKCQIADGKNTKRDITFEDFILDENEILRTSTPAGDSTVRFLGGERNCFSQCSPRRIKSSPARRRPKSSFTPRSSHDFRSNRPSTATASMATSPRLSKQHFKITKDDLEHYLPKKSFFNCHDKVLKDAGYEVEERSPINAKKRQFMELLQKRNRERIEMEKAKKIPPPKVLGLLDLYELEQSGEDSSSLVTFEDQQPTSKNKKNSKASKKKGEHDEEDIRVDYQLLLIYLRYVKENPEEFIQYHRNLASTQNLVHVRPGDSIVRLGHIFQRGRHGLSNENILVTAVHDIRPRFTDPGQWANANKEKELMALTSTKKENSSPMKPETSKHDQANNQEEPKSEYERIRIKLEGWLKTVTTAQLNKAKELALRDLGQEDVSLSRWWVSLRSCNYIRQIHHRK